MVVRQAYQSKHRLSVHFTGKYLRMAHLSSQFFSLEALFDTEGKPEGLVRRTQTLLESLNCLHMQRRCIFFCSYHLVPASSH